MLNFIKKQPTARIVAFGFAFVILVGSGLLCLPISLEEGVTISYIDALYTSTSAVCVTGLVVVDVADTFSVFGQTVIAFLIQIGGLGVTAIGAGVILAMGKKMNLKGSNLIHDSMNLNSGKKAVTFVKDIFLTTIIIEGVGAILSFIVFIQDFSPLEAFGMSIFHSIAAFNNSGFDLMGNFQSMMQYKDDVLLNIVTAALIFFGGIGFLVIREMWTKKFNWKKFSMHAKVVLSVSGALILIGTLLIKITEGQTGEHVSWLGAFFSSVSARTAGFATYNFGGFTKAGQLVIIILMFIGASPGSTGGGIKTSTFFVVLQGVKSAATNKSEKAFKYSIAKDSFKKSAVITLIASFVVMVATYLMLIFQPGMSFVDALFEMVSAFGTVGLSTLSTKADFIVGSKILTIIVMYIGRLGPLTVATLWYFSRGERIHYPEGDIAIG